VNEISAQGDRLLNEGVQVLFKPFDVETLLARIATILDDSHAVSAV